MNRRDCLQALCAFVLASASGRAIAEELRDDTIGNFRYIYVNPQLREEFFHFLVNVFHLYPEHEFHAALLRLSQPGLSDESVYTGLQKELDEIRPFLGALRYAIPALRKQKAIMADQTMMLLDPTARYDGHLEIGSNGRYISILEDKLNITGDVFLLHTRKAGYGPEDLVDRGQLTKIGTDIDMTGYSTEFARIIPHGSLDLVTVFIGFHHCPIPLREEFISSVRDVISPGGTLILRDHDARNEDLRRIAALAHDTFNAGTRESWQFNRDELRNFYSLRFIVDYIEALGFRHSGQVYFQNGDPTRNGLTSFRKI